MEKVDAIKEDWNVHPVRADDALVGRLFVVPVNPSSSSSWKCWKKKIISFSMSHRVIAQVFSSSLHLSLSSSSTTKGKMDIVAPPSLLRHATYCTDNSQIKPNVRISLQVLVMDYPFFLFVCVLLYFFTTHFSNLTFKFKLNATGIFLNA